MTSGLNSIRVRLMVTGGIILLLALGAMVKSIIMCKMPGSYFAVIEVGPL